ncbi:AAA family ATPase [Luteolibacter flavescens]|uniref:AAA family ATPase n=1 Tax=Luteolibacter flavescens TaxID=1859460 RepID=A0ABT3FQX8_9BACT|nr:AAA family ATPase [Luteolibacter flavescens]MCW1885604.1 AAA family ATPase [Luteolibacter flavescens]
MSTTAFTEGDTLAGFASRLDAMIAAMPEDDAAGVESAAAVPTPRCTWHPIYSAHGWPNRYTGELDEATGGEWLASIALLRPVIESGGIGLLHGKRGAGKTRMAAEIARSGSFPLDRTAGAKLTGGPVEARRTAVYRTAMGFFLDVRATYKKDARETERDVIEELKRPGLLVIDELQERGETAFENRLLTHLIDARYGAMLPTIIIANLTAAELGESLGASVVDRVYENGKRIDFTWNSYRRAER